MRADDARPFIVFEMANNHMGSLDHGLQILRTFGSLVAPFRDRFDFGFKLQYRDLDTFIHPDYQKRMDLKYVKRFRETRLAEEQFKCLREEMDAQGFIPVCTPFDEVSVERVEAHGFKFIKIASCSFGDWPLMERIAVSPLPIIASTAGVPQEVLDQVVSFFDHRQRPLTLMHCIGEYPTPASHLQLNQIDFLRTRYPQHRIGFSTHEVPDNTRFVQMAVAKGATVFEKHVGVPLPGSPLNAYSASPEQIVPWLEAAAEALVACGSTSGRYEPIKTEADGLHELRRGVYATEDVPEGTLMDPKKVLFAMPTLPDQLTANDFSKFAEFRALEPIHARSAVFGQNVKRVDHRERVLQIVGRVRTLLQESHAVVSEKAYVEISHHYGLDRFDEIGMTIVNVVNRAYCKKLLVLLPGQHHPEQYHLQKEETFHILHGTIHVKLDGVESIANPGDVLTVEHEVRHEFWSESGAVIEEISSTHLKEDSYYTDPAILQNTNRKTHLTYFFG
jgi:sialic acid synthase SpsE/mannose-6-phosphate isomerase-like protein (cupin superfamily)